MIVLTGVLGMLLLLTLTVWLCCAAEQAEWKDEEAFARDIAHLLEEDRIRLWTSYYREQAQRNLV